jgi:hypothetical protein
MSYTPIQHERQAELLSYATEYADRLRAMNLPSLHPAFARMSETAKAIVNEQALVGDDRDLIIQMQSFDGYVAKDEAVLVWLRLEDHTVVAWGGNCYDYDMNRLAEVKL